MQKTIETIPLDGGRTCFDFINTVHSWKPEKKSDFLKDYRDFLAWCRRLSVPVPSNILRSGELKKRNSAAALIKIIKVRDVLYNAFSSLAQNSSPDQHIEATYNKYLTTALASIRLQFQPGKVSITNVPYKDLLISPLFHVLKSSYDVLTLDDISRIKQCPGCGWIFYDSTKNNRRQWCNPLTCGSMDKSKRYYWRKKARSDNPGI